MKSELESKKKIVRHKMLREIISSLPLIPSHLMFGLVLIIGVLVYQDYDGIIYAEEYWFAVSVSTFSIFLALGLYGRAQVNQHWKNKDDKHEDEIIQKKLDDILSILKNTHGNNFSKSS